MAGRVNVVRQFECNLNDLSVAFYGVILQRFGEDAIRGMRPGIFGWRRPVSFVTVKTGITEVSRGLLGSIEIRGIRGVFTVGQEDGPPYLHAIVASEQQARVEEFFAEVQNFVSTSSIYKGKAIVINVGGGVEFMDLSGISAEQVVYSRQIEKELGEHVWGIMEESELCRSLGVKLQRKILFSGPYGAGKTLAALLTAQTAVKRGWTFFYIEPTVKGASNVIDSALRFARYYQPAVVFVEDFDREQREGDRFVLGRIMASIDGVLTKNAEILVIMTTNFPDKIAPGLKRPGRIDKTIMFEGYKGEDIVRLLKVVIPLQYMDTDIDWERVALACDGYTPAFVAEVGTSARLSAIRAANGNTPKVSGKMLIEAAEGLRAQFNACGQEQIGLVK